ncbi:MAG: anaerobic nitric oxide reductase flavorubredoxin, partial [Proteobacteria bacterium]|nr:anaerobic nitric oxide reductase flavorubredoxin [Pseudomonadota bacterium]
GTSYNSYLIQGSEKTALIDTVWARFGKEFVENLKKVLPREKIDYVIANHAEPDHSGALPELMKEIPDRPIYCTANGLKSFKGYYHKDWNFQVVKTGDKLSLGSRDLIFVEAAMLHWPDTMFSYLTKDNVLFSNDAFGNHYASELMYNDLVDQAELFQECIKYYANILTPFNMMVDRKIKDVLALNLPVDMICPSHGVIWRSDPLQIVKKYQQWAADYQENQITIVYDSMWEGTRRMAEALARGITEADSAVAVKLYNISRSDKNDVITEIFRSKAILVGSPTINRGILFAMAGLLEMTKGLSFKKKKAAAFGCYGWSGESVKIITESLRKSGFELLNDGIRSNWMPGDDMLTQCSAFGKNIAEQTK